MKKAGWMVLLALSLLTVPGCEKIKLTYDQAVALAKIGGMASAETWVISAKPTPEQVAAVSGALDVTNQALINYSGQGDFADALPQIYEGIDKLPIDPGLKPMADSLAEAVVLGVDFWFSQNPDWKNKGEQSAKIASAFVVAAKNQLPKATQNKAYLNSRTIKARVIPPKPK